VPLRMTMPCWLPEPACSSVICMILNVRGSAALHMVKVPLLLENVPAVISCGFPGRLLGPAYQHSKNWPLLSFGSCFAVS